MAEMKANITAACVSAMLLASASGALAAPVYLQASSTDDQFATDTKPKLITMNSDDAVKGITNKAGVVTVPEDGVYFVVAAGQIGAKPGVKGTVRLWLRQNGTDVANSNCEQAILDPAFTTVLVSQGISEFKKGDTVQAVFSSSAPGLGIIVRKPAGEAVVPSIIFSIYKIN
jgi:hypothetical protein